MEISIKWNLCRVCLWREQKTLKEGHSESSNKLRHLFNDDKRLSLYIYELTGVSMKPDDSLPDKICTKCVSIINNAAQFRKTCRSSNVYLQSILAQTKSTSTLFKTEKLKFQTSNEEVVENEFEKYSDSFIENQDNKDEERQNIDKIFGFDLEDNQIEHPADNVSDNLEELEEFIEVSEDVDDQMFSQIMDSDTDEGNGDTDCVIKYGTDNKNNSDSSRRDSLKNCKTSNDGLSDCEEFASNGNFEYIAIEDVARIETDIEETITEDLDETFNGSESQAQVSSTVVTNDEIEYYEDNSDVSNFTNDLHERRSLDDNYNTCNITSTKMSSVEKQLNKVSKTSAQASAEKRKCPVILPKRNRFKCRKPVEVCVCNICGNHFTKKTLMNIHMKVHYQHKNHQCELCAKRFITACNLQAHMRTHTGEKPFVCKYCGRRFNDRSSNLRHERLHTNEKPFECTSCGKTFSLSTTLQNHMKVHTNERLYRCEPCGKSFKLAHHLKTHRNTSLHKSVVQTEIDES